MKLIFWHCYKINLFKIEHEYKLQSKDIMESLGIRIFIVIDKIILNNWIQIFKLR